MIVSPLELQPAFGIGPILVSRPVVITLCLMTSLVLLCLAATRRLALRPGIGQSALELFVETLDTQIRDTMQTEPEPYRALIGSIFLFVLVCNWSSLIPASIRQRRGSKPTRRWPQSSLARRSIMACAHAARWVISRPSPSQVLS